MYDNESKQGSKPKTLSLDDLKQLGYGALKVAAGAAATYTLEWASGHDWGDYKIFATVAIAGFADLMHKFLPDTRPK